MKKILITIIAVMLVLGAAAQSKTTTTNTQKQTTTVSSKQTTQSGKATVSASSKPATATAADSKASTLTTVTIQTNASKHCKSCINRFKENVPFFKGVKEYKQPRRQLEQARMAFDKAEMNLADRLLDYGYTLADTSRIPADQKRVDGLHRPG